MALTYEQTRRQAEAGVDAFNRCDPDGAVDGLVRDFHVYHGSPPAR